MGLEKYGKVEAIRASGIDRRLSITGKVVYDKNDSFNKTYAKTIIVVEKNWNELGDEDGRAILDAVGIDDSVDKVAWRGGGITTVKDKATGSIRGYYVNGFTFDESSVEIRREIDFSSKNPTLKIIKGRDGRITREQIEKRNHDDSLSNILSWVFFFGSIFLIWLLFAPK